MDFLKDGEWVMALMGGFQGFKEQDFHGDIRSTRSACYEYMIRFNCKSHSVASSCINRIARAWDIPYF